MQGSTAMPSGLGKHRDSWQSKLVRGIAITDLWVLVVAAALAQFWRFGTKSTVRAEGPFALSYEALGAVIVVIWWIALGLGATREPETLDDGPTEYERVGRTSLMVVGFVALVSLVFKWDMSRGYLAIAFPLGLIGLMVSRKIWRVVLRNLRAAGRAQTYALVFGQVESARRIAENFKRNTHSGFTVVGVVSPGATESVVEFQDGSRFPVYAEMGMFSKALVETSADSVIVAHAEQLGGTGLRELAWRLQSSGVDLMVSPHLVDVAGTRIHLRLVGQEPYIHLEEPRYAEAGQWPKRLFDVVGASILLLLAAPLMLVVAVAIKVSSPGSVFYRQERIGLDGRAFGMIKFRSMRSGADAELSAMMAEHAGGDVAFFKMQDDPRVTNVGRFIRRYSIDELPQLINVVRGDMSLVGPRPQREHEVALYDHIEQRRLTVRPGMTGLWQVSGRSDLSKEDSMRLDNYYVENWSLTGDVIILIRTFRAVVGSSGAY